MASNKSSRFWKFLAKSRMGFFQQKYRFDQGNGFLGFVNFSLLVIGLVKTYGGNQAAIPFYVMGGFFGTWFLGYFLDHYVKIQDAQEKVALQRSPLWQDNYDHHGEHNKKLELAYEKLKMIEDTLLSEIRQNRGFYEQNQTKS